MLSPLNVFRALRALCGLATFLTFRFFAKLASARFYNRSSLVCCFRNWRYIVVLLFYVHGKHLRSCRAGQLT